MRRALILLVLVAGCGQPLLHPGPVRDVGGPLLPPPDSAGEIDGIILDRSGCLGTCPAYTIVLQRDGHALRVGGGYSGFPRCAEGTVPDSAFAALARRLFEARFFELRSLLGEFAFDVPYISISASLRDGRYHEVRGIQSPPELTPFWHSIDSLAATIDWQPRPLVGKHQTCSTSS